MPDLPEDKQPKQPQVPDLPMSDQPPENQSPSEELISKEPSFPPMQDGEKPVTPKQEKIKEELSELGIPPGGAPKKKTKILLAALGVFLLIATLPAAVYLVRQRQEIRKEAFKKPHVQVQGQVYCQDKGGSKVPIQGASVEVTIKRCEGRDPSKCEIDSVRPPETYTTDADGIYRTRGRRPMTGTRFWFIKITDGVIPADYRGPRPESYQMVSLEYNPNDPTCPGRDPAEQCRVISGFDFRYRNCEAPPSPSPTPTPPVTPTPTPTPPGKCNDVCRQILQQPCEEGLVCWAPDPRNLTAGFCRNPDCPEEEDCVCPTPPPGYTAQCEFCKVYDEDWEEITDPSTIAVGQTVYFATQGSTTHPQGITKARFRINGGSWQETTSKHGNDFYIPYTIPAVGSYTVESMVYNPVLGWY